MPSTTAVARAAHVIPERAPIQVHAGDRVVVGRRDEEWPAFVFVETADGAGWVPSRYLTTESGPGEVVSAYDTTELPVGEGEVVEVLARDDESGWLWCRSAGGREGWVPARCLEESPAS